MPHLNLLILLFHLAASWNVAEGANYHCSHWLTCSYDRCDTWSAKLRWLPVIFWLNYSIWQYCNIVMLPAISLSFDFLWELNCVLLNSQSTLCQSTADSAPSDKEGSDKAVYSLCGNKLTNTSISARKADSSEARQSGHMSDHCWWPQLNLCVQTADRMHWASWNIGTAQSLSLNLKMNLLQRQRWFRCTCRCFEVSSHITTKLNNS